MASQWRGDEASLQQICQMFAAASSPDQQVQQQVWQCLTQLQQMPDFNMYLVAVFAQIPGQQEVVRQRAGLLLKTNVTNLVAGALQPAVAQHISEHTLAAMGDPSRTIRQTAGTILTTMVQKLGLQQSGPTLEKLVENLGNPAPEIKEGSLSALSKICEDQVILLSSPSHIESSQLFVRWSNERLLPRVFECAQPAAPLEVRISALECINHFALNNAFNDGNFPTLQQYSNKYIECLGVNASDTNPAVLKAVCKGFSSIIENSWACLTEQHYDIILKFMLKASQNAEYSVRYEALSVWGMCGNSWDGFGVVRLLLPELVPVLLENMVYSPADYMGMEQSQLEDDNAACPDSLDDIKPRFHKEDKNIDDDDEEDGKTASTWGAEWTARKAAASSLDTLSCMLQEDVIQICLPHIQTKLGHSSWEHQEAGVLAIGAIGVSCMNSLAPFLPAVMELLIGLCSSQKPLLRSISCWCISRFSPWVCHPQTPNQQQVLTSVLKALLQRCLDRNKRVQEAACSAFAHLEEAALTQLAPFLDDIVRTFVAAFQLYQTKNLRNLYDAMGTLAWAVGPTLNQQKYVEALLVPIIQKFEAVPDNDITTVALFECVSNMCQNLGTSLVPVIPRFVQRCMAIVPRVAQAAKMWEQNPNEFERPDRELMAASVDLLAGIIDGLGERSKELLAQTNFLVVLGDALKDNAPRVQQSGYALMGTCASKCMEPLVPMLPDLLPLCAAGLGPTRLATVKQNASWAIGEVVVRVGPEFMAPYLDILVPALAGALQPKLNVAGRPGQGQQVLLTNVSITMGRVGLSCGDKMGKYLPSFMGQWCVIMRHARADEEKAKAFQGMCNMIKANAAAAASFLPQLLACCSVLQFLQQMAPPLLAQIKELLHGFKSSMGPQWGTAYAGLDEESRQKLQLLYQLA